MIQCFLSGRIARQSSHVLRAARKHPSPLLMTPSAQPVPFPLPSLVSPAISFDRSQQDPCAHPGSHTLEAEGCALEPTFRTKRPSSIGLPVRMNRLSRQQDRAYFHKFSLRTSSLHRKSFGNSLSATRLLVRVPLTELPGHQKVSSSTPKPSSALPHRPSLSSTPRRRNHRGRCDYLHSSWE